MSRSEEERLTSRKRINGLILFIIWLLIVVFVLKDVKDDSINKKIKSEVL